LRATLKILLPVTLLSLAAPPVFGQTEWRTQVQVTRQFDFTVPAGDSFYVWAVLIATADTQGEVDAFSTLTASLTNTAGLETGGAAPPAEVPALGRAGIFGLISLLTMLGATAGRRE
jgi:hypothetical protein